MNISYRARIDEIDDKLVALFAERMQVAAQIAAYKKENGLPILDEKREQEKLAAVAAKSPEDLQDYTVRLYKAIMALSREYQKELMEDPRK